MRKNLLLGALGLICAMVSVAAPAFADAVAVAACKNGGVFSTDYAGKTCSVGPLVFSGFTVAKDIPGGDITVFTSFTNNVVSLTSGYIKDKKPTFVFSNGDLKNSQIQYSVQIGNGTSIVEITAVIDTIVERGASSMFDQQVRNAANNNGVSFNIVFDTLTSKSTKTNVAGPANLNVVDLATGDARKGGAGGILSIADKYTLAPEPATGIAGVLLVGAAALRRRKAVVRPT